MERERKRRFRRVSDISSGVLVSALVHLAILTALNIWLFVTRMGASGYVINCEMPTRDDGAETELATILDTAFPDEPPPGEQDLAPTTIVGGGTGDAAVTAVGGGGGDGRGRGGSGVGFFGTRARGNSFVFIVDRSGSMKDGRLIEAKKELNRAISELKPDQRFYVFFYNARTYPMLDPSAPEGLEFATAETRTAVRRWMRPLQAGGGTEPAESLRRALALNPDVIFFLTDGQIPQETPEVARAENYHGTTMHTIALVSREGESMLQAIAQHSGGKYRYIAGPGVDGVAASGVGSSSARTPEEKAAQAKLRLARKYLQEGRPRTGRKWLNEVVTEHPHTPQAAQARQLLQAL